MRSADPQGGEHLPGRDRDLLLARPEIAECAVIGLPDEERGALVCAVLVPAGAVRPTLEDIRVSMAEAGLMPQKIPPRLELLDELPRTGLAKIANQQLRKQLISPATEGSR